VQKDDDSFARRVFRTQFDGELKGNLEQIAQVVGSYELYRRHATSS
jgi:hypothetical protein